MQPWGCCVLRQLTCKPNSSHPGLMTGTYLRNGLTCCHFGSNPGCRLLTFEHARPILEVIGHAAIDKTSCMIIQTICSFMCDLILGHQTDPCRSKSHHQTNGMQQCARLEDSPAPKEANTSWSAHLVSRADNPVGAKLSNVYGHVGCGLAAVQKHPCAHLRSRRLVNGMMMTASLEHRQLHVRGCSPSMAWQAGRQMHTPLDRPSTAMGLDICNGSRKAEAAYHGTAAHAAQWQHVHVRKMYRGLELEIKSW